MVGNLYSLFHTRPNCRYHSGSPLVALHAVRGGADALLIGANSHRAVLWDRHTGVQIATIALDLGDAMVLPPDRPSVTCFDAVRSTIAWFVMDCSEVLLFVFW